MHLGRKHTLLDILHHQYVWKKKTVHLSPLHLVYDLSKHKILKQKHHTHFHLTNSCQKCCAWWSNYCYHMILMNFFSHERLSPPMDGLSVGIFSGLLSTALLNTQFYKTKSSCALLLYPVSAHRTKVPTYTWIQNNALYHSATKNSEPLPGGCLNLASLPCTVWCHKNSENSIILPKYLWHSTVCCAWNLQKGGMAKYC